MFCKSVVTGCLGVILLSVASCSVPKPEASKTVAKSKALSENEKWKKARAELREDEAYKKFGEMIDTVYADGALPQKTKQLIAIGISVTSDCQSCMRGHVFAAHREGANREEVFEAIRVGIAMGGGPAGVSAITAIEEMQEVYPEPSKTATIAKVEPNSERSGRRYEDEKKEKAYVELTENPAFKKYQEMLHVVYADGALPRKTKELIALGISITRNCETCVRSHVERAAKYGSTKEEVSEAIMVAVEMGGTPAGTYALTAIEKMQEVYKE